MTDYKPGGEATTKHCVIAFQTKFSCRGSLSVICVRNT